MTRITAYLIIHGSTPHDVAMGVGRALKDDWQPYEGLESHQYAPPDEYWTQLMVRYESVPATTFPRQMQYSDERWSNFAPHGVGFLGAPRHCDTDDITERAPV